MVKLLHLCASVLLTACATHSSPPVSCPPPPAPGTESQPTGATEAQGEMKEPGDLKNELAAVDAALTDLSKRLEVARGEGTADLKQQLAALQKRGDDLEAQLRAAGTGAATEAENARREIHRAAIALQLDIMQFAERIPH